MSEKPADLLRKYLTNSMFWLPEEITSTTQMQHLPFLFWLVEITHPNLIVQLGVNHSNFYYAYCYAVKKLQYLARCYAIDTWLGEHQTDLRECTGKILLPFLNQDFQSFSKLIHAPFDIAKNNFANNSIDLLHIAGGSSSHSTLQILNQWHEKLSSKAILIIDNLNLIDQYSEKNSSWIKLKEQYPFFFFSHANGLGIIGIGPEIPTLLRSFFADTQEKTNKTFFHNIYYQLGIRLNNESSISQLSDHQNELETIKTLRLQLKAMETSNSWRITAPLRKLTKLRQKFYSDVRTKLINFIHPRTSANTSLTNFPDLSALKNYHSPAKIAVVLHIYYADLWQELRSILRNLSEPFDLFVSLVTEKSEHLQKNILNEFPQATVAIFPNHGRDVLPFIYFVNTGILTSYDAVLKLHTKKSLHIDHGNIWRTRIYHSLAGSSETIEKIISAMRNNPLLGLIAPPNSICGKEYWCNSEIPTKALAARIDCKFSLESLRFVAGTMFWVRPSILRLLQSLHLTPDDFETEQAQLHNTMAHHIERFIGILCESAGMEIREVSKLSNRENS